MGRSNYKQVRMFINLIKKPQAGAKLVGCFKNESDMECDICADIASKKSKVSKKLSKIILDCWQREYSQRPYSHLIFHGHVFERKFHRKMTEDDFLLILQFLNARTIDHFEFLHCAIPDVHMQNFLKCLDNLVSVNFTHSIVPMQMFRYLADNGNHLNLKTLMLCGNQINEKQSEHLRLFLLQSETLEYLDVSDCGINHITLATISDGIVHCKNLKSIDVSNIVPHHPQRIMDTSKISIILSILIWSSQLLEVHYRKVGIDSFGMDIICDSIAASCLRILDIGGNVIGPDGTESLFKALKNSSVIALLIPFNKIGDGGGKIIAKSLCYTKLEHLDISFNEMSSETVELILTSLTRCNTIRSLSIFGNDLNSETVGSTLHILITNNILHASGLDVAVNYANGFHQMYQVENQIINNFLEFQKLSKYCTKEKINPRTLMWFKKSLWNVVGHHNY